MPRDESIASHARPRPAAGHTAVLMLALVAGCGSDGEPDRLTVHPVTGRVEVGGKPAAGARVMLHPTTPDVAKTGLRPHGTADDSGTFRLTTYEQGDGAPAGEYRVTVTWPDRDYRPRTREEREDLRLGGDPPDKLGGRYARPEGSGLTASVPAAENHELPRIQLR